MRILPSALLKLGDIPRICIGVITLPKYKQLDVINKISYSSVLFPFRTYLENTG